MKLIRILFLFVFACCNSVAAGGHAVNVVVPIPAMTNAVAQLSCHKLFHVRPIVSNCVDLAKYIPNQEVIDLVAQSDVYLSLGLPFEIDLCSRALQKKNSLQIFQVTNGCNIIDHNMYVWLAPDNMDMIAANVRQCLMPERKSLSWSCMPLKDIYKNLGLTVALAHPAFEYLCTYFGVQYIKLYDANGNFKRGNIENMIRRSKVSFVFVLEHQSREITFLASKGFDVGSIDIGDAEAPVQFSKFIYNVIVKEGNKIIRAAEKE